MANSDMQLIKDAQAGDGKSIALLYRKYVTAIYRFVFWQTNSQEVAEDLTQDTFVEAVKSLHSLKQPEGFKNWLYTIAKRQVAHWLQKKYQLPQTELPDWLPDTPKWIEPENQSLKTKTVAKLLATLPSREQAILKYRYLKEHTVMETAEQFKLTVAHIKVICHRAIKKLGKQKV